ncbi:unnamed protein product [Nyctereutes procyonoides]|uniref:(raccoon dog) hypothetical protein n=1 Tax=Nyctereutes procyonoides TaxID=34880 RepID=A0A811ZYZ8_NYCPR|nr:unnamed protein product [Nyctereutes procyonoides]
MEPASPSACVSAPLYLSLSLSLSLGFSSFIYKMDETYINYLDPENKLGTCPWNACHRVSPTKTSHHVSSCDDKTCIEQDTVNQTGNLGQETLAESTWQCLPCDEERDKDLWKQTSTPFVWGTASQLLWQQQPCKQVMATSVCVPRSPPYILPWKNNGNIQLNIYLIKC